MYKGKILKDYEIVQLIGYKSEITCLKCDIKLTTGNRGASDAVRWWCPNDQCSRYGLETMLAVDIKSTVDEEEKDE